MADEFNASFTEGGIIHGGGNTPTPSGETGADGKSAYDIAVENGFNGTVTEWLESLKGAKGDKGDRGEQGVKGDKGDKGADGAQGIQGERGEKGDKGDKGESGADGTNGKDGTNGTDGKSAYQLAVENGFSGTESEWLASLKGEKGDKGDSIPNYFAGKSAIAFGTSITMRCSQFDNGGYVGVVKDILGLSSYKNNGMDGFSIAVRSGIGIVKTIESASNLNSYDLITIEGGTNDFKLNLPLGEVGEMGDSSFDKTTFCGALRSAIEHILTAKPSAYIVLIADPQRNNAGYDVNYVNSVGYKLMDYVDAMIEIGNLYGIPVCPWYYVSGINAKNLTTYTGDGLHPNATGYSRMGRILAQTILNQSSMVLKQVTKSTDDPTPDDPTPDDPTPDDPEIIPTGDTVTVDGKTFNIADAGSEPYKVIMKLSSSYYLYLSSSPMHTTSTYNEKVKGGCKRIADPGTHIFRSSNAVQLAANNGEYYIGNQPRTKDNYVWTNHDITVFGSNAIVLSAETL